METIPRWVLYELRQRLRTDSPNTHDWASIVAYATIARELEAQVEAFHDRQVRSRLEVCFARIDEIVGAALRASPTDAAAALDDATLAELKLHCSAIRAHLQEWCDQLSDAHTPAKHAERYGLRGASEKRIAISYALAKERNASLKAYRQALDYYQQATDADPTNHWLVTQVLCLSALPELKADVGKLASERGPWWVAARQIAEWQMQHTDPAQRVWALVTLAELELLGTIYAGAAFDAAVACQNIAALCHKIREQTRGQDFPRFSALRQFRRYANDWPSDKWKDCADAAIKVLDDQLSGEGT